MKTESVSRRTFLKKAAALAAAPTIVPASVIGRGNRPAPSNRIVMASIGIGDMGTADMQSFLHHPDVQVVAVCDVDADHRIKGKNTVEQYYAGQTAGGAYKGCAEYGDFRELIARNDIDALSIALPDHWHAIPVIMAAKAGKDMYVEKPLGLTIEQGRAMSDTVRRYGRVFQTGSQLRSFAHVKRGIEIVRSGGIGEVHTIFAVCGHGPSLAVQPEMPVPKGFDYEMWLGPAPWAPYHPQRCHQQFRWNLDYSGGQPTDHGAHYCDLAQLGLGTQLTGPVEFEGKGHFPPDGLYNTATTYNIECVYPNGVKLIVTPVGLGGTTLYGTEGMVYIGDEALATDPPELAGSLYGESKIDVYESFDHHRNFLDCVKSRRETIAPIEEAHRSITIGHIGNIAMKLGRKLRWDPDKERFVNDSEADKMLSRAMRAPWRLDI